MGYKNVGFHTLIVLSVTLSFLCGLVCSSDNQPIEIKNKNNNKKLRHESYDQYQVNHGTTTVLRQSSIEVELQPIPNVDGKCELDIFDTSRIIKANTNITAPLVNENVDYWFAIGTPSIIIDEISFFLLHQSIYSSIQESNIWCTETYDNNNQTATTGRLGVVTFIPTKLVKAKNSKWKLFYPTWITSIRHSTLLNITICFFFSFKIIQTLAMTFKYIVKQRRCFSHQ
jgi:hypothetical protein